MRRIKKETACELCGMGTIKGTVFEAGEGYVCYACVKLLENAVPIMVDASEQRVERGMANTVRRAQVRAGEQKVIANLKRMGL